MCSPQIGFRPFHYTSSASCAIVSSRICGITRSTGDGMWRVVYNILRCRIGIFVYPIICLPTVRMLDPWIGHAAHSPTYGAPARALHCVPPALHRAKGAHAQHTLGMRVRMHTHYVVHSIPRMYVYNVRTYRAYMTLCRCTQQGAPLHTMIHPVCPVRLRCPTGHKG